jgi:carboxymethylenebutenolidase
MHHLSLNHVSAISSKILLVVSLLSFSSYASAQHLDSGHAEHHSSGASKSESSLFGEMQDWAKTKLAKSPRHQEWVNVKHGNRTVSAFIVYPEVKKKATAVVVIHEINGLTDWVQSLTDQLAEAGYIAIAPDLLSGMGPKGGGTSELAAVDRRAVGEAIRALPPDQVTADLNAVAAYVSTLAAANGKVAVAGFCWGGSQSFRYATNNPKLKGSFVFYGSAPEGKDDLARIKAPIHGFYAGNDARINASLPATIASMKELKKRFEPETYEGAGHAFMRSGEGPPPEPPKVRGEPETEEKAAEAHKKALEAYLANQKARDAAWERWKKILSKL